MSPISRILTDRFNILIVISTIILCNLTLSCENDKEDVPDVSRVQVEKPNVKRLERELSKINTKEEVVQFLDNNSTFSKMYLQRGERPDSILVNDLFRISTSPYIDTLTQETEAYFGNMDDLTQEFEKSFKFMKHYYPEFTAPPIYTIVTGFASDIVASDSMIVIGLDCFLDKNSRYPLQNIPNYITRRYKKEFIVPTTMLFISNKYNEVDILNKSMLAEMIHYGKSYQFAKMTNPSVHDTVIIGYTAKEYEDCLAHQDIIWAHFIENNLFFETSHQLKTKYVGERPFTGEIGEKCPGRVGRWLGWQIVRKYMKEHPSIMLKDLMANKNAQAIFEQAKYKPKVNS